MKKLFIGAVVAFGTLAPFAAVQAQAQEPAQARPDQASVAVTAPRPSYSPAAGEFAEFANTYALGNGQVARFVQRGNHYYVQLQDSLRALQRADNSSRSPVSTRLHPVGPGVFVTDSGAELTFREHGDEVAISGFERLPQARVAAAQTGVQMVARR